MIKILISILSYAFLLGQPDDMFVQDIIRAMDEFESASIPFV